MSAIKQWQVIVNPTSGNGRAMKKWKRLKMALEETGLSFQEHQTQKHRHSKEIVEGLLNEGQTRIAVVGGDGTLHNVINGWVTAKETAAILACIPTGTGNDWARSKEIPKEARAIAKMLQQEKTLVQDIGKISFKQGSEEYFMNVAGLGFDAFVVEHTMASKAWGAISYLFGMLKGVFQYRPIKLHVKSEQNEYQGDSFILLFGKSIFAGGGMKLLPHAQPTDGMLAITHAPLLRVWELLINITKVFSGKFVDHPKVNTYHTKVIEVKSTGNTEAKVQADGELVGETPITISIANRTIPMVVP